MESSGAGQRGDGLQNTRLHASNPSKVLRARARATCKWCGNLIDWFDRFDGGRIPLTPMTFPSDQVPAQNRWNVDRGIAHHGAIAGECRIPHPAICPSVDHVGQDPEIARMTHVLRLNTRKLIDSGVFTPPVAAPEDEEEIAQPEPAAAAAAGEVRHVLCHGSVLKICPGRVEDLRCVADADRTGRRCESPVFDATEGRWTRVDIPHAAGRNGKAILLTYRGQMWVWEINPLEFKDALRWLWQKCPNHRDAPEAYERELIDFSTARHAPFILSRRPEGYGAPGEERQVVNGFALFSEPARTQCAADGCWNGTVVAVKDGWLCWQCTKRARTREVVRRKWQQPTTLPRPQEPIPAQQTYEPSGDVTAAFIGDLSPTESLIADSFTARDDDTPF
ncbi:DUF6083 domain-containing protein [Kitasatospora sp. NPDC094015]|uniref:DUF6083 domain-containing protein n=1 Tax=Kitasatospora sp. NPDC094015 TaxID=3155205 RepID=UPI003316FABA